MGKPQILIVDEDTESRNNLITILQTDYSVLSAENAEQAINLLIWQNPDIILMDIALSGFAGVKFLNILKEYHLTAEVVMLVSPDYSALVTEAIHAGVINFLDKPADSHNLLKLLSTILTYRLTVMENQQLISRLNNRLWLGDLSGSKEYLQIINEKIITYAKQNQPILITGENGTEKDIVAYEIYKKSRRDGNYIKKFLNVETLEDISFLYQLNRGVLVLDELADLSLDGQKRLLSLIDNIPTDVLIILYSSISLRTAVASGKFLEELYRKITAHDIYLPPLKERLRDIPLLVETEIKILNERFGLAIKGISDDVLLAFTQYPWPGNLAQLKNILYLAAISKNQETISIEDIPLQLQPDSTEILERLKNY